MGEDVEVGEPEKRRVEEGAEGALRASHEPLAQVATWCVPFSFFLKKSEQVSNSPLYDYYYDILLCVCFLLVAVC